MNVTQPDERVVIQLDINGSPEEVFVSPRLTLADALRESLGLTGTKLGCEQGVCGACTVLLDGQPARACLVLAVQASGHSVQTVEGLSQGPSLTPLQQSFQRHHALQCGFCTAGFLMTSSALLEDNPNPKREEIREAISGNICRCTGYETIIDAVADVGAVEPEDGHREEPGSGDQWADSARAGREHVDEEVAQ
jgi:aerobic-type carbon monoxide dehydrogenase small subunit (CoxS/CutS family)